MPQHILRVTIDVVWPQGSGGVNLPVEVTHEIVKSAMGGVRAGLSDELVASHVTIQPATIRARGWHIHFGKIGCIACQEASTDGKE